MHRQATSHDATSRASKASPSTSAARQALGPAMSSLAFASAPTLFAEGGERPGAEAKRASAKARGEAYVQGARATKPEDSSSSSHELKYGHGAFPGVLWAEDWRISFGSVRSICVSAWLIFLLMPILFFTLVRTATRLPLRLSSQLSHVTGAPRLRATQAMPTLQPQLPYDLTTFGLVLFVLTALFFLLTGCVNPGVPAMPHVTTEGSGGGGEGGAQAGQVPHPGEQYSLSRDTNRYVRGFDHFCEFVGNDIGKGNLPCFVTFLVLLSALSTYVVVLSAWLVADHLMPPLVEWHWLTDVWRIGLASAIVAILGWALYKCGASEVRSRLPRPCPEDCTARLHAHGRVCARHRCARASCR